MIFNIVHWASLVAQTVKNLSAMPETWVQSLHQEDPLEKEMATHSSILAWRISWTEEPGGLHSVGSQRIRHGRVTDTCTFCCISQVLPYLRNGRFFSSFPALVFSFVLCCLFFFLLKCFSSFVSFFLNIPWLFSLWLP